MSDACVERLDLPVILGEPRLVVDGLLTNVPGTHSVKLFKSATLDNNLNDVIPITSANVKLIDNRGNTFSMLHMGKGVYSIENFAGIVGHRYKLQFSTDEGKEYESTYQQLSPPGEITDLRFELAENFINLDDPAADHDVFRFYINAKSQAGSSGLFRWRWTSVFEALTRPELRVKPAPDTFPPVYKKDPMPCSGFVAILNGNAMEQIGPCVCCTCWVTDYSNTSMVSNNQLATRPEFYNVQVAQVPLSWKRFQAKFYIKLEQLSLSDEVYEFWKNLQSQQTGTGSIFQPNVIRIKGNIKCTSDPTEDVAGIFSVAGSTQREMFINRLDIPKLLLPDTIVNDCRNEYPGSTNVKPFFW